MAKLLEMKNITKKFGDVCALNNISISLDMGEVLSLCGENGSGKSTLMKVLCGIYPFGDYEGEIYFSGEKLVAHNIKDTEQKGISIIHQELTLVKNMSILENMFLGNEISQFGIADDNEMYLRCQTLLQQVQLDVDPHTKVGELGLGQQQLVEIAKALNKQVRLLILDEPTASLTEKETTLLLNLIKDLQSHNIACVYISHKLNEVKAISDNICVIRDGEHIGTRPAKGMSEDDIITMMVGREITSLYPHEPHDIGDEILRVENLTAWHPTNTHIKRVDNANFTVHRGEILGVAGLVGSGRTEMVQCLFGSYEGKYQGDIFIDNQAVQIRNCAEAISHHIVMVPEDRKKHGIVPIMGVGKNITLAALPQFCFGSKIINEPLEQTIINQSIAKLTVKTSSAELAIGRLSGGNQQKAILAKCLLLNPKILILDEPTRGIDVGAKYEIYKLINQLAQQGMAIIIISSELPEVLGISDRVLVMHQGQIKADLINQNLTQEQVMEAALKE
ncbi:xylose ABC transporter ATP-binding protein [Canicola haemoglobinophilus]|uniref:Xylose transporter ATP-binding subunit n=1 Tax=Canicola haemoglobinophilus TaxID=733 RepID=A0A1V4AYT1_9PAST|nr:D-xylose ABC transporter ATP-binding protein [Canicola haemoglobinophilus]OOR97205.1 xylose ABC transporter ATP-binding protein [Canicola haemoglobinophilus]STO55333.1 xylose transporter ATP-binding subunit [Canicola haemoglobinophilus]STO59363.1 xylose transporter ATP-binding subunit [Canicola haemoglobinophilus]STO69097.1 xylose transporter ATP-binding subunit [Canicola haemoglobinophilus]